MKPTVSSKGQLVLPAGICRRDRIEAGQEFEFERLGAGCYRLTRLEKRHSEGVVDWLLACPEKNFFKAVVSESTDTL